MKTTAKSKRNAFSASATFDAQTAAFEAKKPVQKKEVLKLKRGALLEIKWLDSPNTFGILIEKPEKCKGDVSLKMWFPADRSVGAKSSTDCHAVHSQVVAMHGYVELRHSDIGPTVDLFKTVVL